MAPRTRLQLSLDPLTLDLLRKLAEQQRRSLSNTVEWLIYEATMRNANQDTP
jgi:hypothetical protein